MRWNWFPKYQRVARLKARAIPADSSHREFLVSDVVFILGAGASKSSGAPVMGEFLEVARLLQRQGSVESTKDHFLRVFNAVDGLQAVHSKAALDLDNIESIFTVLELGRIIRRVPGLASVEEVEDVIDSLKTLIVQTLQVTMRFPLQGPHVFATKDYAAFAELVADLRGRAFPSKSVSIISFNYDIAVDIALTRQGLNVRYCLDPPAGSLPDRIDLLKLHGSLNWATEEGIGPRKIHAVNMRDYLNRYTAQTYFGERSDILVPIGDQLAKYFKNLQPAIAVAPTPLIVPPSWNKADYHHDLTDVWAAAAKHLSEAEHIFVLGYSLPETDAFFRHLYALGSVGKGRLADFAVYDPDASGRVDDRFKRLLGPAAMSRYSFNRQIFGEALSSVRQKFPMRKN